MPVIDPGDYWHYRTLLTELERDQAALGLQQARVAAAEAKRQAAWTALAAKYGLALDQPHVASDDTCQIEPAPPPALPEGASR